MCGIGALISPKPIEQLSEILTAINETLKHRGPDGNGLWSHTNRTIGFCHTRLSIIDLSNASAQPLHSFDNRFTITFNGEIYNYQELRKECIAKGSQFKSTGDVEVIVELYRYFGKDISTKLRGMWAFLIYDNEKKEIFISRDPFGIKPLFYGLLNQTLIFTSEIKALHKINSFFLEVDTHSVDLFKKYKIYDRGNWTFFKNIKKFPAAHDLLISEKNIPNTLDLQFHFYLDKINFNKLDQNEKTLTNTLRELFENSLSLHMRSDVPVGFCLSGGIDSSAIVATASKIFPNAQLVTFTTKFPNHERVDETQWAQKIIDHVHAKSIFVSPNSNEFALDLPHLIETQDEPFGSASIYSQYCIFRQIKKSGIKVVLDGQGADEIFAGYHSFFPYYIYSLIEQKKFFQAILVSKKLKKNHGYNFSVYRRFFAKMRELFKKFKSANKQYPTQPSNLNRISRLFYNLHGAHDTLERRLEFAKQTPSNFEDFLSFMVFEGNVPMLLRFEDRNSMAFSVESRVPFLINELVEFSLRLPSNLKMKNGITKYILRESMRGIVPDLVLNRMDKLGFPAPDKEWLKELYNYDVAQPFSDQWIELILKEWYTMLERRQLSALAYLN